MPVKKGKQGFASMSQEARTAIARKGGRAAHAKGAAHEWTVDEARAAGAKGGTLTAERRRAAKEGVAAA
jgi:general stress protein YciG